MARTDHGQDLSTPVLQPGTSVFRRTESGFDQGQRSYTVDVDSFAEVVPDVGDPDPEGAYPNMFVREVEETKRELGLVHYTLNFRGVMKLDGESGIIKKRKRFVRSRPFSVLTSSGGASTENRGVSLSVRDVYVTDKLPDLTKVNLFDPPPDWDVKLQEGQNQNRKDVTAMSASSIISEFPGSSERASGWHNEGIDWDEAGLVGEKTVLYEVTETRVYKTPLVPLLTFQSP